MNSSTEQKQDGADSELLESAIYYTVYGTYPQADGGAQEKDLIVTCD